MCFGVTSMSPVEPVISEIKARVSIHCTTGEGSFQFMWFDLNERGIQFKDGNVTISNKVLTVSSHEFEFFCVVKKSFCVEMFHLV